MRAQEGAACNGSDLSVPGVAPCTEIAQERIERCELILEAVLRGRPEFSEKRQNYFLCERKGGRGNSFAHLNIHLETTSPSHPAWPG